MFSRLPHAFAAGLCLSLLACGGGGDFASLHGSSQVVASFADEGLARFNEWRALLGLPALERVPALDAAAQGHSEYQARNNVISHYQTPGLPGFTGECVSDSAREARCSPAKTSRLEQAGYTFGRDGHAFGEVISKTVDGGGSAAADSLVAAIYHRFVVFEPMFTQAGAGAARSAEGATYFTADLVADGLGGGIGPGKIVVFPFDGQLDVPRSFSSDQESPDPVPSRDLVGYPVSVHADIYSGVAATVVKVDSFTIRPLGGSELAVRQLWSAVDAYTQASAAAIVPLEVLQARTTYEVQFSGTVAGQPVSRGWRFTTGD